MTYAMLAEAECLRQTSRDVVVGVTETHGRGETMRLLEGLEVLPREQVEYKGHLLQEFDIDRALAWRPMILLRSARSTTSSARATCWRSASSHYGAPRTASIRRCERTRSSTSPAHRCGKPLLVGVGP